MGLRANIISLILKSTVENTISNELAKDILGLSLNRMSEMFIDSISDFIKNEKSNMEQILSTKNLTALNISNEEIPYVLAEIKDLLLKIDITDEVLRNCKYDSMYLSAFLWKKYCELKNEYIENEYSIKQGLFSVADTLIKLFCESENFEKKLLLQISNSIDDTNAEIEKISKYIKENYTKLNQNDQILLDFLLILFKETSKSQENNIRVLEINNFNKKEDYVKKWNSRLFLHLENNEKPLTLANTFIMPDYIFYKYAIHIELFRCDVLDKVIDKFIKYKKTSTMLIIGEPGIGKTSIVSWIANKYINDDKIIILRFRDWSKDDLQQGLLNAITSMLNCNWKDLEDKVLVLDGFDEIKAVNIRDSLLNVFLNDILDYLNFKIIITSRPNYLEIKDFRNVIKLLSFDAYKISKYYQAITNKKINLLSINDESIIGIPVILYMAIMADIDITEKATKPELYNQIFAKEGGIFDKFSIDGIGYDEGAQVLRNSQSIKIYLEFLQNIAFFMFQQNSLTLDIKECQAPSLPFQGGYINVLEFPIKNIFVGIDPDIEFIHKSIYDYFVSEFIIRKISESLNKELKEFAGDLARLLIKNRLTDEIIEFLNYKIEKDATLCQAQKIYKAFLLMLQNGMTYYVNTPLKNGVECEMNVFVNMLDILHLWKDINYELNDDFCTYIKYNRKSSLNLKSILGKKGNLCSVYLKKAKLNNSNLQELNLSFSNLWGADFTNATLIDINLTHSILTNASFANAILIRVDLAGADLENAVFEGADLRETNLNGVNLGQAHLTKAVFTESQIIYLKNEKYHLWGTNVYMEKSNTIVSYGEYNIRHIKNFKIKK